MAEKSEIEKASETAFFAALRRAIACKDYGDEKLGPDYLAGVFLPAHFRFFLRFEKIRENTKEKLNGFFPGLNEYMIARTAYFDKLFSNALNRGTPQIVLLGAGYDTRAYRFATQNTNTTIIELDAAPTQNRKLECLRKARVTIPERVKFASIDFNKESLKDVLENAGYDDRKKTLFLWEGVSYYLDKESVDAMLEFVSQSLHDESAIAFDYTIPISDENVKEYYGVKEFVQTMKEHHTDEELMFSIDDGKVGVFLNQKNLKVLEHLDNEEIEREFLLNDNGSLIGKITGHFRFVMASKQ